MGSQSGCCCQQQQMLIRNQTAASVSFKNTISKIKNLLLNPLTFAV
jgi:hypothetical protein